MAGKGYKKAQEAVGDKHDFTPQEAIELIKKVKYVKFDDRRWYRIRVRVTSDRIQAWIDDDLMADQEIRNRKISIRPEVDLCKPLGIASWQTRAALRKIEYRRLTGETP